MGHKASSLFRTLYKSSYENKSWEVCIMFKKIYCMALDSAEDVEPTVKIAVNNGLQCMYKIGVYGDVKQHEVLVYGTWWNYMRFKNELDKPRKKR